jgi:hypothetical protein
VLSRAIFTLGERRVTLCHTDHVVDPCVADDDEVGVGAGDRLALPYWSAAAKTLSAYAWTGL